MVKCKAAVLYESGYDMPYAKSEPLKIETVTLASPGPNELLIQVRAAGLCHSDLSVINGSRKRQTPMVLGHEAAGVVTEVGENVTGFDVGDHVVCAFVPSCGQCLPCKEGRPALCEPGAASNNAGEMFSGGTRIQKEDGTDVYSHIGISGFSEYSIVSTNSAIKIDPDLPFDQAALFGCAVITGLGAVINTAAVKPGTDVAVVGLGGIGMNAVLGSVLAGAKSIIAVDLNEEKLAHAKELGATAVYNASDDGVVKQIKADTAGGVHYAFETAGVVPAMKTAYNITRRGGTTITSGLPDPKDEFSFPQVVLTAEERTIKGSYLGSCVPTRDIPRYISLFKQGKLPVDQLIGEKIALEDINEGFDRLHAGKSQRIIVEFPAT
ncbi:zinc-dependent alcohol dehydrogenase family protein [Geomicrobium sp. JCM 19039]|uniref:zinc-dependent alcohol dehydrogenase family protein n=1 Tax=Geomicrobium sp. JCM 19039 TaxID=1460636 RepID=UPI00045F28DB|nr:zinc-dependent alcohol dehydrogenase family protein [Geomicrobium sp. JCM 19039]GAK10443.1 alcohol dehydrogenase [Geomicrobium sp. JCM 19039]